MARKRSTWLIGVALTCVLLACGPIGTQAHEPGAEYTYMRMFMKPAGSNGEGGGGSLPFSTTSLENAKRGRRLRRRQGSRRRPLSNDAEDDGDDDGESQGDDDDNGDPTSDSNDRDIDERSGAKPGTLSSGRRRALSTPHEEHAREPTHGAEASKSSHGTSHHVPRTFSGIGSVKDGENIKRLTFMLMRILKQYKVQSMVDVPCRAHASWMHKFLEHVDREIPDFKYYCVDTNRDILKAIRHRVSGRGHGRYILRQFWEKKIPAADAVFAWGGLENMKEENVYKFLRKLSKEDRHKLILLGTHMKGSRPLGRSRRARPDEEAFNLRRAPFHLNSPMRVISELSAKGVRKQMYIYRPSEMRSEWPPAPGEEG